MNIVTVIQARTSSTRLNRKILLPLGDSNILIQMLERVKAATTVGKIVVATTINPEDDELELLCEQINIDCFRGHPTDCLDRHYQVGKKYKADAIVKIPSDCPLIDPAIIDKVIGSFLENPNVWDYYSNLHPATYPDGNDVEVIRMEALEKAWVNADKEFELEHTTPYIWERPKEFRIGNVVCESKFDYSTTYRWTIDYIEDYQLISLIFSNLYKDNPFFGVYDIIDLLKTNPQIKEINEIHLGKYWYMNHLDQLTNVNEYKAKIK
ncbi:MAG: glycosyltransferase family protein [Bacteroidota bacterium]